MLMEMSFKGFSREFLGFFWRLVSGLHTKRDEDEGVK